MFLRACAIIKTMYIENEVRKVELPTESRQKLFLSHLIIEGINYLDIRRFFQSVNVKGCYSDGDWIPSKKRGICLNVDTWDEALPIIQAEIAKIKGNNIT